MPPGTVSDSLGKKILLVSVIVLTGCTTRYAPPSVSGLLTIAPFPNPGDVCEVVVANGATLRLTTERKKLIACPSHERGAISDRIRDGFNVVGPVGSWTLMQVNAGSTGPLLPPMMTRTEHLIEQTVVFFDDFHGTQVAYYKSDGREYLWYPGNQRSLLGYWRTTPDEQICFRYPDSSINPATGVAGPEWECNSLANHSARIVEITEGDIFNLASGQIPFVMESSRKYQLTELKTKQ